MKAEEVARLTFEDAMGQADEAMAAHEREVRDHASESRGTQGRLGKELLTEHPCRSRTRVACGKPTRPTRRSTM